MPTPVVPGLATRSPRAALIQRETISLIALVAAAVLLFVLTRAIAAANDRMHRADAAVWYQRGRILQQEGQVEAAIAAFRRAVTRSPDDPRYALELAAALASARHDAEARQALTALRDANPEDPEVNLRLARIDALDGNVADARRYYQNALAALWAREDTERRRLVRVELIRFLLDRNDRSHALSILLDLTASLPDDANVLTETGGLFLRAGDPKRALDDYMRALALDPLHPGALAGAGRAAFDLGDYARALRYLRAAPGSDVVRHLRSVAELVTSADPLARRIGIEERRRRMAAAIDGASSRLDSCLSRATGVPQAPDPALPALRDEARDFGPRLASPEGREAETIDAGMDVLYRVEEALDRVCQPTSDLDRALLLICRRHDQP